MLSRWQAHPLAHSDFTPHGLLAVGGDEVFIAGRHEHSRVSDSAAVYRWRRGREARRVYTGPGHVLALALDGAELWALVRPRSGAYTLLRSSDRGSSWREAGPVPTKGASGLVAGEGVLWVHGIDLLLRSDDTGASWTAVTSPIAIGLRTRLAAHGRRLYVHGDTFVWTEDGGERWTTAFADVKVTALDREWVAVETPSPRLARVRDGVLEHGPAIPTHGRVVELAVDGPTLRVLAVPEPTSELEIYKGWIYLQSDDGGESWQEARLSAQMGEVYPPAALPRAAGFVVSRDGSLHVYSQP